MTKTKPWGPRLVLLLYVGVLLNLTLVQFRRVEAGSPVSRLNLTPFATIRADLQGDGWGLVVNTLGNLAAFALLGWLLRGPAGPSASIGRVAAASFVLSFVIESGQYLRGGRVADVDDLLLNTAGGLLGLLAYELTARMRRAVVSPRARAAQAA